MLVCPRCRSIYDVPVLHCGIDGERTVEQEEDPLINQVLDRYRIVGRLGRGAMGVVYRAAHTVLRREYAIKVLFGELGSNGEFVQRLRREAETVSMIKHPNVIVVEDFGTTSLGVHFLVMELVPGMTLADALASGGPFPARRVANIARQMAAGLAEAHRLGLVHRDVKPSNVMLTADDGVKIMDFGVVSVRSVEDEARARLTTEGALIGTPMYMAPEQVEAAHVTFAADLYSMGIILYELLAGTPPFRGTPTEVLVQQIAEKPEPLPPSSGLEKIVARLLEKRPEDRPSSAFEVIEAIDALGLAEIPQVLPTAFPPLRARELDEGADENTVTELNDGPTQDVFSTSPGAIDFIPDTADLDLQATHQDSDGLSGSASGLSAAELALLQELSQASPSASASAHAQGARPAAATRTEVLSRPRNGAQAREAVRPAAAAEQGRARTRSGAGAVVLDRPIIERTATPNDSRSDPRSDFDTADTGPRPRPKAESVARPKSPRPGTGKVRRMVLLLVLLCVTGIAAIFFFAQHTGALRSWKSVASPSRPASLP